MNTEQLVKTINAHLEKGDHYSASATQSTEKAEQHYISAGQHLITLKAQKPKGVDWKSFVRKKCALSQERADQLIRIADGRTTLEQVRSKNTEGVRRFREKSALRNAEKSSGRAVVPVNRNTAHIDPTADTLDEEDEYSPPDDWVAAMEVRAAAVIAMAKEIETKFPRPFDKKQIAALRHAADAWNNLLTLKKES